MANRFAYLEEWLRREPSHNSFRVWVNDDGGIRLHVYEFDGHRVFDAPTLPQAIDAMKEGEV